jgi:hypothetical protein
MMHLIAEESQEDITAIKYTKILKTLFFLENSSEIKQSLGLCALCCSLCNKENWKTPDSNL